MSPAEITAELVDATETLAHLAEQMSQTATTLADQEARTSSVYGAEDAWPASSYMAVQSIRNDLDLLTVRYSDCLAYKAELEGMSR